MTFNILAIRQIEEDDEPGMYPLLTPERRLAFEEEDGRDPMYHQVTAVSVREAREAGSREVFGLSAISADLLVTGGRVALVCARYDKGGGWWGSPGTALLLNAVSMIRARIRSRGKALVGHVRYVWLEAVGFSPKKGLLDVNQIRLVLRDGTVGSPRTLYLDLTFGKYADTAEIARAICMRTARQRLSFGLEMSDQERAEFERLANPLRPAEPEKGQFALYRMPRYWKAAPRTAGISKLR